MFQTKVVKFFICMVVLISINTLLHAENRLIKNNMKVSFLPINLEYKGSPYFTRLPSLQLSYDRQITEYLCVGASFGGGRYDKYEIIEEGNVTYYTYTSEHGNSLSYNVITKLKLLPLLNVKSSRLDLYLIGKLGGIWLNTTDAANIEPKSGNYLDASFSGGVSFYFSKNIGLFVESGYQYFEYHKGLSSNYGLSVRF